MKFIACAALAAYLAAASGAGATEFVVNGDFTQLSSGLGQLNSTTVATGWSTNGYNFVMTQADLGSSGVYGGLTLYDAANYAPGPTGHIGDNGSTPIYGNPVGNAWNGLAAGRGNFVAMDGDFSVGPLTQMISGLTPGAKYNLTFSYAFGQQTGYNGDTSQYITESLGDQSFVSTTATVPSHGFVGWTTVSKTITAGAATETLSFLATGNLPVPPFAMISDVSLTGAAPEPASWALMILGLGLVGATTRRRAAPVRAS